MSPSFMLQHNISFFFSPMNPYVSNTSLYLLSSYLGSNCVTESCYKYLDTILCMLNSPRHLSDKIRGEEMLPWNVPGKMLGLFH